MTQTEKQLTIVALAGVEICDNLNDPYTNWNVIYAAEQKLTSEQMEKYIQWRMNYATGGLFMPYHEFKLDSKDMACFTKASSDVCVDALLEAVGLGHH